MQVLIRVLRPWYPHRLRRLLESRIFMNKGVLHVLYCGSGIGAKVESSSGMMVWLWYSSPKRTGDSQLLQSSLSPKQWHPTEKTDAKVRIPRNQSCFTIIPPLCGFRVGANCLKSSPWSCLKNRSSAGTCNRDKELYNTTELRANVTAWNSVNPSGKLRKITLVVIVMRGFQVVRYMPGRGDIAKPPSAIISIQGKIFISAFAIREPDWKWRNLQKHI